MTETCANCNSLDDSHSNDNIVTCRQCSKNFHAYCADIDDQLYELLMKNKNLSWSCNDCIGKPANMEINNCLGLIMEKLGTMSSDIEALKVSAAPKTTFADMVRKDATPRTPKRRAGDKDFQFVKRTRTDTPSMIMGTGEANNALVSVEPLKWLYVSRLHPQTSEESVLKLLTTAHNVDEKMFTCVKLMPRMQNPTFISFKVGMSNDLLLTSLAPDIWPAGVAIREFVNRPRNFFQPQPIRLP